MKAVRIKNMSEARCVNDEGAMLLCLLLAVKFSLVQTSNAKFSLYKVLEDLNSNIPVNFINLTNLF